jgi:hypothetical protein
VQPLSIDLTPVVNVLLPLALAAVSTAVPILVGAALKRLHVANAADIAATVATAADAAAGAAYRYALAHEGGLASVPVHDASIAEGVAYMDQHVPDAVKALGLTQDHVKSLVAARLGSLLAGDPTVSAGAPKPQPLPEKSVPAPT